MREYGGRWAPYISVAARRKKADQEAKRLAKQGQRTSPVIVHGRNIAQTFWGKAWCDNLEAYSDYDNRLPRGRTYVRNGSVIDLQIQRGEVAALVSGSEIYRVKITVAPVSSDRFKSLCDACAGAIDSVVELLGGKLSKGTMTLLCAPDSGLFPSPAELRFSCSCPDWASMCKHVAASLYGVGARLDHSPELLFTLRDVDHLHLIAQATSRSLLSQTTPQAPVADGDLEALFGIELDDSDASAVPAAAPAPPPPEPTSEDDFITAAQLIAEGIPRTTFQNWITAGHLQRTDKRGVYRLTPEAWQRIESYFSEA